jgi:tight adherence protein C
MEKILTSAAGVFMVEAAVAAAAALSAAFLYLSVTGFLERRRKLFELTGVGGGFTGLKGLKELAVTIRKSVEKLNTFFTKSARYREIEKILMQLNLENQYTRESFMLGEEAAALGCFAAVLMLFNDITFALAAGVAGFMLPVMIIRSSLAKKKYALLRAIPGALDIISAYVEGGLSLSGSVIKYSERATNVFAQELSAQVKKIQLGSTFPEVMKDMSRRLDTKEVNSVVNAFIQAETSGGSVRDIIKAQAAEIRKRHFMALKQKAHEAPVKLLIPMIIFIFPVIFIVLFGPIVIKLMSGF